MERTNKTELVQRFMADQLSSFGEMAGGRPKKSLVE